MGPAGMEGIEAETKGRSDGPEGDVFAISDVFAVLCAHVSVPFCSDGFARRHSGHRYPAALRRGERRIEKAIRHHTPVAQHRGAAMKPNGITRQLCQQWPLV